MLTLPEFPWNALAPARARASEHSDGLVDLSVGSPIDPTPPFIRDALTNAADSHGYPTTQGTLELRTAIIDWFARVRGVSGLSVDSVLPTIGSKEFVGLLPVMLGLGERDIVVHPTIAYPTYDIGARVAGATALPSDDPAEWPTETKLVWLNSPSNPTGRIDGVEFLAAAVARARELGAVIINDECYARLTWTGSPAPSILDPRVTGGSIAGVLAANSLSKQSNLAGYRAAFVAGDSGLLAGILAARMHLGLIVPLPVQAAMTVALGDDAHVDAQHAVYRARRDVLAPALVAAGFHIDFSDGGIYLWVTRNEPSFDTVDWFAARGILVAPGSIYGAAGSRHVRVALTADDERIAAAAHRVRS